MGTSSSTFPRGNSAAARLRSGSEARVVAVAANMATAVETAAAAEAEVATIVDVAVGESAAAAGATTETAGRVNTERNAPQKLACAFRELATRIKSKGLRTYLVLASIRRLRMAPSNEELLRELQRLRTEIQQLREIVNALFNAVFEESDEDWDALPEKDEFNLYN